MKKSSFLIIALISFVTFSVSFASIKLISPSKSDSIIGVPIILNWELENDMAEEIPVIYSIYLGTSQETLELYEDNLLAKERAIFFLPDDFSGRLYWKIIAYNSTGIIDESEINSFKYISSKDLRSYFYGKPNEIKILLSWEKSRFNLDLHLTGENIAGGDIHMFAPLSDENNGSPWPGEIRMKSYRRENKNYKEMTLSKAFLDKFLDSEFRLSVESKEGDILSAEPTVEIYFDGELAEIFELPDEKTDCYWNVFDFTQANADDLRIDIVDKLSKTSSSLWTDDRDLEGNILVDPYLPIKPPVLDIDIEADLRLVDVDDFIDILEDLDIEVETGDLEVAKIVLPQNVELDTETMSVFVNDVACKLFIRKAKKIKTTVDIMFVVDRSGSMDSEIAGVERSLEKFINHLNEIGFNARVGLLPYGSNAPSSAGWQDLSDYSATLDFIYRRLNNSAGGYEVPYTAINYVFENAGWNKDAEKHIILVTDEDSEENGRYESLSKSRLIKKLGTEYVVHTILSPEDDYNRNVTNYTSEADPREVAEKTNGIIEYTDSYGNVDLTTSGILNFAENSYYIFFERPEGISGDIEILYETNKGTGYSSSK